ncbi:hypothetical protein BGX26_003255 [Mortierella sp. AD094]|nr:hypothetical protein BGX26_003255 [Mortierella sp. AD094]
MDFAELSGLEFKFFDDYKQEVVNQFTQDIHSEIHSVEYDYFVSWKGSSARAAKAIPLVGSVVGLCDKFTDQKELAKGNLTYDISKSIKERVISKFSDTLSDVGKTFNKTY